MAGSLECTLTTPEEILFEGAVLSVVLPAADGELGILPRHAPLVCNLGYGELRLDVEGGGKSRYFVDGGFLEVLDNHVSILAASAVGAASIDPAAEDTLIQDLESQRPPAEASFEERERHGRSVAAAKAKRRMVQGG